MKSIPATLLPSLLLASACGTSIAGTPAMMPPPPVVSQMVPGTSVFEAGRIELQSGTGAFWSFATDDSDGGSLDFSNSTYRLGIMLTDVQGEGWMRGNSELLIEGFYSSVFQGSGDWLAGGSLLLRYNFVPQSEKWIPYLQAGAGGLWNDVHKDQSQSFLGQCFEFNFQASAGLRYQFNERWGAQIEGGWRYITNFGNADRDSGLNSAGAMVGLIRTF